MQPAQRRLVLVGDQHPEVGLGHDLVSPTAGHGGHSPYYTGAGCGPDTCRSTSTAPETPAPRHRERGRRGSDRSSAGGRGFRGSISACHGGPRGAYAARIAVCSSDITATVIPPPARRSSQRFLPLARQLARRYQRGGEPLDDLIQVASLGPAEGDRPLRAGPADRVLLVRGADDPRRAQASLPRQGLVGPRPARPAGDGRPRRARDRGARSCALGRAPTPGEIAEHIGDHDRAGARGARGGRRVPRDLARPPARRRRGRRRHARDSMGIEDPGFRLAEHAATVERLMAVLTDREREVLRLRFGEDLTQSEIGERVGVSQMHVSRLIRQAIDGCAPRRPGRRATWPDAHAAAGTIAAHGALGPADARRGATPAADPALRARRGALDRHPPARRRGAAGAPGPRARLSRRRRRRGRGRRRRGAVPAAVRVRRRVRSARAA